MRRSFVVCAAVLSAASPAVAQDLNTYLESPATAVIGSRPIVNDLDQQTTTRILLSGAPSAVAKRDLWSRCVAAADRNAAYAFARADGSANRRFAAAGLATGFDSCSSLAPHGIAVRSRQSQTLVARALRDIGKTTTGK